MSRVLLFLVVLLLDQFTKYLALTSLKLGHSSPVLDSFFNLTLVFNPGAAFGMFGGLPDSLRRIALGVVSVIALVVILRLSRNEVKQDAVSQYALLGILAGAVGNFIDRLRFDSVVDFLDFYYKNYHWPAFNIADSAISIGVVIVVWRMVLTNGGLGHNAELRQESE